MNQKDRTEMEKKTFHAAETFNGRTEQLKEYLRRLGASNNRMHALQAFYCHELKKNQ